MLENNKVAICGLKARLINPRPIGGLGIYFSIFGLISPYFSKDKTSLIDWF